MPDSQQKTRLADSWVSSPVRETVKHQIKVTLKALQGPGHLYVIEGMMNTTQCVVDASSASISIVGIG